MRYLSFDEVKSTLGRALGAAGFDPQRAGQLADVFARNTLEGVASHGVNRFPRFLADLERGVIDRDARPETVAAFLDAGVVGFGVGGELVRKDGRFVAEDLMGLNEENLR